MSRPPFTGPQGPPSARRVTRAQRRRLVDLAEHARATELREDAERRLHAVRPEEMDQAVRDLPFREAETIWPRLEALRALAADIPDLAKAYQEIYRIYWEFVPRHKPLVYAMAAYHAHKSMLDIRQVVPHMEDGVFRAAIAWDPERSSFSTTARWYARAAWQRANDRHPAVYVHGMGFHTQPVVSLDQPVNEETEDTLLDTLAGEGDTEEEASQKERLRLARAAIANLSPVEQRFLALHVEGRTNQDIAALVGLSRERIRQVLAAAVGKVRTSLGVEIPKVDDGLSEE